MLSSYLAEVGEPKKLLDLSPQELDKHLDKFWHCARKVSPEEDPWESDQEEQDDPDDDEATAVNTKSLYKTTSLINIRHAIKRYLKVSLQKS